MRLDKQGLEFVMCGLFGGLEHDRMVVKRMKRMYIGHELEWNSVW
jgi:hypothetical protein